MPQAESIDNFIEAHQKNPFINICGKLAIARCILEAESSSLMYVDKRNIYNKINFHTLEKTWYNALFQMIVNGVQLENLARRLSKIAIVTFNYDRCIETYLHGSLRNYYGIEPSEATSLLRYLTIFHPYGHLGDLPTWTISNSGIDFGSEVPADELINSAKRLKTFSEGIDKSHSDIITIRSTVENAKKLAYLGFSYNRSNLQLLYDSKSNETKSYTSIYGTAYGLSKPNIEFIQSEIADLAQINLQDIYLCHDLTCAKLFQEYSRNLMIP